jgi:hypothetical protein
VLKVPEAVSRRAAAVPDANGAEAPAEPPRRVRPVPVASAVAHPARPGEPDTPAGGTRVLPAVDEQRFEPGRPAPRDAGPARLGRVPWWMRLALWVVAVPLSFLAVFLVARAFGLFTSTQLSDLFLANDRARFWPVARLLPFVALVTAAFVQLGVYGLARLRGRSRP